MILTPAEMERLPLLFREIVATDRDLSARLSQRVIYLWPTAAALSRARSLRADAQRAYMPGANGTGRNA